MTFVVESGIPFTPRVGGGRGRKPTAFPLDEMEVGDSFLIECDVTSKKAVDSWRRKLLGARKRFAAAYEDGDQYKFQTVTELEPKPGLRVHRTA